MGLDMYAYAVDATFDSEVDVSCPVDEDGCRDDSKVTELFYWRKHPNLHGWMEQRYREKGGKSPDFNCDTLVLTKEDLDRLEAALDGNALPHTTGFFFGASDPEDLKRDREFIKLARHAIDDGKTVVYDSWW